jgi:hypothetical protein
LLFYKSENNIFIKTGSDNNMKYSCTHCNSGDVQKISVLLASGTQKTVTEESKRTGTILAPVTMMGDVKTGRKSISVTESDLVKLVREKIAVMEAAEKPLQDAYDKIVKEHKKAMGEHQDKMAFSVPTPALDQFERYHNPVAIILSAGFFLWSVFSNNGFSISGLLISLLLSGVVYLIAGFLISVLLVVLPDVLRFFKPQLAEQLSSELAARSSARELANASGPEMPPLPTLKAPEAKEKGFFCHTCGEIFIPQEL